MKDAVVNAVEELYLKDTTGSFMDPRRAAENLVSLAGGSSLGKHSAAKMLTHVILVTFALSQAQQLPEPI